MSAVSFEYLIIACDEKDRIELANNVDLTNETCNTAKGRPED